MDVHDVSSEYHQTVLKQKQNLENAKKRKGERPRDRPSRDKTYARFIMVMMGSTNAHNMKHVMNTSFIPPAYAPCIVPVTELKPMNIRELCLETHHRGKYLMLRVITPPSRMTAIMVIVEDERGDVSMLSLYQQEDEDLRPAVSIVGQGTILLVKEPYYKVQSDGEYGLRVDHISDVIQLDRDARVPKAWRPAKQLKISAAALKEEGNKAVAQGRFWDAITKYSEALRAATTDDEIEIIKRNRALALLTTGHFDGALSDTDFPHFNNAEQPNQKAMFRAAEALYSLDRYEECIEVLKKHCALYPTNDKAFESLDRTRTRMQEKKTGNYGFKQLQAQAQQLRPPHLDFASYAGPIEIRQTESKGRGLFVTQAVKVGDLLLCEKAFYHAYAKEKGDESGSNTTLLLNIETTKGFKGTQAELLKRIIQKLHRNPSLAPSFTALYHGDYEALTTPTTGQTNTIIDTFLIERIVSSNVFGCPTSSSLIHKSSTERKAAIKKETGVHHSSGIWTLASYINHSCMATCRRSFIGNMMIVRATRDLLPNTELSFGYKHPATLDLQKELQSGWEFNCSCAICLDNAATAPTVLAERRKIRESVSRIIAAGPYAVDRRKAATLIEKLDATYTRPAHEIPRLLVWEPQVALAQAFVAQKHLANSVSWARKALISLGFLIEGADGSGHQFKVLQWGLSFDEVVEIFLILCTAFIGMGLSKDAEYAYGCARMAYRIAVGEDETFGQMYPAMEAL